MENSTPKTTCDLCLEDSRKKFFKCSTEACVHPICIECCARYCSQKADFQVDCPFCKASKIVVNEEDIIQLKDIMMKFAIQITSDITIYLMSVVIACYRKMKLDIEIDTENLEKLLSTKARGNLEQWNCEMVLLATKEAIENNVQMFVFEDMAECVKLYTDVNEYISNQLW